MISDLGLCWNNASVAGSEETVKGVLPYVAPEVLRGMPYTRACDVYSVGMIMYELWSGRPPFEEKDYDVSLAVDICSGKRFVVALGYVSLDYLSDFVTHTNDFYKQEFVLKLPLIYPTIIPLLCKHAGRKTLT